MWVMDVRLPPEPTVPVVAAQDPHSELMHSATDGPVRGTDFKGEPRSAPAGVLQFIASDVDLIYAVTGETIWPGRIPHAAALSAFARQIAYDRRGVILGGEDVTPAYLVRTGKVIQANGGVNPYSGLVLDRALLFLARRQAGRIDTVC